MQGFDDKCKIKDIIQSILTSLGINDLFNILNICTSLYGEKEGLRPIIRFVADHFVIRADENVNDDDKAKIYYQGLGNFYYFIGDYKKVLELCNEATRINNALPKAWHTKGLALRELKKYNEALTSFSNAIDVKPDYVDAVYYKGVSLSDLGRIEESIACYDKAIEMNKYYPDVWRDKGSAFLELKRYEDAIACYDKAIEIENKFPFPGDGNLYVVQGWMENPYHSKSLVYKAVALSNLDRYEEAIECLDEAIRKIVYSKKDYKDGRPLPRFSFAWTTKGYILTKFGKLDEAIINYDKAIQINPNDVQAWTYKGACLLYSNASNSGRYDEALKCYNKALEIDPKYTDAWNGKGNALYVLKNYDEAIKCYDRALDINPNSTDALNVKGAILNNLGRYEESVALFKHIAEIVPNDTTFKVNLVEALLNAKRYDQSEMLAKEIWDEPEGKKYEVVMRFFTICSLYLRDMKNEAKKASLNLLKYYESMPVDYKVDWDFGGLKNMIYHSTVTPSQKEELLSMIELFETKDKQNIMSNLRRINDSK